MRTSATREPRFLPALVAVGVHVGMVVLAWALPEPPPKPSLPQWARTEVVLLDPAAFDVVAVEEPQAKTRVDAPTPEEPEAVRTPASPPPTRPHRASTPSSAEQPGGLGEEGPAEAEPVVSGSGISLSGLRGASRARAPAAGVPRPNVVMPSPPPQTVPKVSAGPAPPRLPSRKDRAPRSLAEAGFKRRKDGSYRYRERGVPFKATIHPNGRVEFSFKGTSAHHLGMTEAMRAASGEELFAAQKKRLLAETLALRMALAQTWAREQMRVQLKDLQRQLLSTWKRAEWGPPRRRAELFTLWDDCEESLTADLSGVDAKLASAIDRARAQAGTRARAKIVAFINQHLPHDSTHAYTRDELRKFNATRRSKRKFEPYEADRP